jgi:hypothetical protein
MPTDATRTLRARAAAHQKWAVTGNRAAATEAARKAADDRFMTQAREMHPGLSEADLSVRAESLRKAFYSRLALASVTARRARKGA